jgi:hypothetical protein
MKTARLLFPLALAAALLLSGCATRYQVRLDALSELPQGPLARGAQTYVLASETPEVEASDLFFKEVTRHVETALRQAGFRPAAAGAAPDLRIGVKAYLSEPIVETRSYSDPIYIDSPGYSHIVRVPVMDKQGKFVRYAYTRYWSGPRTRFAGYVDRDRQITVYDKVLRLSARALDGAGAAGDEVWSLTVALRGESTDYRSALPYMLVAAQPYIGRRTEGEEVVTLRADAPELEAYKSRIRDGR